MIKLANVKLAEVIPPSIAVDAKMRAIADAVDVELNKQPGLIKSIALWAQLNTLPSGVLDHLAWQFNVPVWRDSWPQATKVSVLRTAIRDKSVVGTRGAVERAVESLGSAVQIVEWFEASPVADPYTFEIIIDLNSIPGQADVETQDDLRRAVDAAKPARSHYRVILSLKLTGLFGMYATGRPAVVSVLRGVSVESFDPLALAPLGWWDHLDASTLFIDAAGTTPSTAVGDPIGLVRNKAASGAPGNVSQTVSAQRPQRTATGLLFAGGTTGNVWLRSTQAVGTPVEIVAVARYVTSITNAFGALVSSSVTGGNPNPTGDWWYVGANAAQARVAVRKGSGTFVFAQQAAVLPVGQFRIFDARITSTEVLGDIGGTTFTAANTNTITPTQPIQLGGNVNTYEIAEVFVFDRVLTTDERAKLKTYLEARHGI